MRRDEHDEALREVGRARQRIEDAKLALKRKEEERRKTQNELIENNYTMAQEYLRLLKKLDKEYENLELQLEERKKELELAKQNVLDTRMKVEALEKLREKQEQEFYDEQNRLEQIETDEKVALKFASEMVKKQNEEDGDELFY
jgi:flagellar export protein FliJ